MSRERRRQRREQRRYARERFEFHMAQGLDPEAAAAETGEDVKEKYGAGLDIAVILRFIELLLSLFDNS